MRLGRFNEHNLSPHLPCAPHRTAKIRRMPNDNYPITLLCHPATPAPVVRAVEAQASFLADGSLAIAYRPLLASPVQSLVSTVANAWPRDHDR